MKQAVHPKKLNIKMETKEAKKKVERKDSQAFQLLTMPQLPFSLEGAKFWKRRSILELQRKTNLKEITTREI
jgi:hypothetical protein